MVQFFELGPMFPTVDEVSPDSFALFTGWSFVHIFSGAVLGLISLWFLPNRIVFGGSVVFILLALWELAEWWWQEEGILMSQFAGNECVENQVFDVFIGMLSYFAVLIVYLKYFNPNGYQILSM